MSHIVLLGDSIFDNASYVPDGPPVIEQLRKKLPSGWQATLLAVDGGVTTDVPAQLARLPADAAHLFVSVGGNDALRQSSILRESARSVTEVLTRFADVQAGFRRDYQQMLQRVLSYGKPTVVCTVYDSIPGLERNAVTALSVFNDVILREAFAAKVPVIDLRLVCNEAADYSVVSPIEPSVAGGEKIVKAIVSVVTEHNFTAHRSAVFA